MYVFITYTSCDVTFIYAQKNYVRNSSFEQVTACPTDVDQLNLATGWGKLITNGGGTPDLFARCATLSNFPQMGVPANWFGYSYQEPFSGNNYALLGLFDYSSNAPNIIAREYAQCHLLSLLKPNTIYCVKFWVSLTNSSYCSLDQVGVYFDDGLVSTPTLSGLANVIPQVKSPSMVFLSDTLNWMLVEGTFTATGNEEYLTIGNFRDNQQTNYIPTALDPGNGYLSAGYYIDDVSVIESDLPAYAGADTVLQSSADSVFLGREPEIGLECVWYDMQGQQIATGAGFWAHPTHTTSYIVEQNLCGNISRDTVTVWLGVGLDAGATSSSVRIIPNPTHNLLQLQSDVGDRLRVRIQDLNGKTLMETEGIASELTLHLSLSHGIYFIHILHTATYITEVHKLLIE